MEFLLLHQLHNIVKTHCDWLLIGLPEKIQPDESFCLAKSSKLQPESWAPALTCCSPVINSMAASMLPFHWVPTGKTKAIGKWHTWLLRTIMTALWTRQQLLKTTVSCCLKDSLNIIKGVIIKEYLWTAGLLTVALSKVLVLLLSC